MALKNLYPPLVDTYMPAFVVDDKGKEIDPNGVRIYFSLSKFNSPDMITSVWLSITNQFTNEPVLKGTGLKMFKITEDTPLQKDLTRIGDDIYYVVVKSSDLKPEEEKKEEQEEEEQEKQESGYWHRDVSYKVQLRFCNDPNREETNKDAWITNNLELFSEWSKVCLLKAILKPELKITGFEANHETIFTSANHVITGNLETTDDELESYQIQIYLKNNLDTPVYDSGLIYSDSFAPNEIYHEVKYGYIESETYVLRITYATQNLYTKSIDFYFIILSRNTDILRATISATPVNELGYINVNINSDTDTIFGSLVIKRASNKTDFLVWEDIHYLNLTDDQPLNVSWQDFSAEHGVWYKYCVQRVNSYGSRGLAVIMDEPVMLFIEDSFLIGGGRSLKLKYNPIINSYAHTMSESLVQTIGSKYPFIKRNGAVEYKQIGFSGMISHFMDDGNLFVEPELLYNGYEYLYEGFNNNHRITAYNDITLEREFRKEVQEFLLNGEVKLFKSPTEGNILVRLMNTSFTPEKVLSRMIYSFNTTMYEIADATLENINKYNVQLIGEREHFVHKTIEKTVYTTIDFSKTQDLATYLQEQENGFNTIDKLNILSSIDNINIQFESDPYLIYINGDDVKPATATDTDNVNPYLGYIIYVNNNPVILGPAGTYNISASDGVAIESFRVPLGEANIACSYTVAETENIADDPKYMSYSTKIVQFLDITVPTDNIIEHLVQPKLTYQNGKYYEKLVGIYSLDIEAEPFSVFYIKDFSSEAYKRFVLGKTGTLILSDLDFTVKELYAAGKNFRKAGSQPSLDDQAWEYTEESDTIYNSVDEIENPENNTVYKIATLDSVPNIVDLDYYSRKSNSNGYYYNIIYYDKGWYSLMDNGDILCKLTPMINIYCEIEKGEYI